MSGKNLAKMEMKERVRKRGGNKREREREIDRISKFWFFLEFLKFSKKSVIKYPIQGQQSTFAAIGEVCVILKY